jgi:Uma2 family endonuclease
MDAYDLRETRDGEYTYADYEAWDTDERYELIDGVPYLMAAPGERHQRISAELTRQFANFLVGKPCRVYAAPFDVRLNAGLDNVNDKTDKTVVQPDLLVICDERKIKNGKNCVGAPDMVIEILSPSNSSKDTILKSEKYRKAGVREIWMVDPENKAVQVSVLDGGRHYNMGYINPAVVPVHILEGLEMDFVLIFDDGGVS